MATLGAIGYIDYKKVENIPLQQIYFELPFYAYQLVIIAFFF
jgi:hypothetical protein